MLEEAQARIGHVLDGKYELRELLGFGSFSAVYEAWHRYTRRPVAVKVLHDHMRSIPEAVQRFMREARATAEIGHPSVVAVLDAGETHDHRLYMVQELVRGETLEDRMAAGPIPVGDLMRIGAQILDGLDAAHGRGVIHRDIKPENIVLVADEGPRAFQAKLVDFGVAKILPGGTSITVPGRTVGTAHYMSPQQARAEEVDGRTDVWAVGAVLFHAASGQPPFDDERSVANLLVKLVTTRAPLLRELRPDLPENLTRAVDVALEPDLANRWPTARAMAEVLRSADASVDGLDWDD